MADTGTVKVEGLRQLRASMRKAGISMEDLKAANASASAMVAQWAGVRAPRRTGRLGASTRPARQVGRARVMAGSSAVPYAAVIHYGWPARNIEAQPYILNAARETESAWVQDYLRDIQKVIDKIRGA